MPADLITAAECPVIAELPCGCRLPFVRCAVADELLYAEWQAGDALQDAYNCNASPAVYAAARARWKAAQRAYDAHIRGAA